MLQNVLNSVGTGFGNIAEKVTDSISPNATTQQKVGVALGLVAIMGFGLAFAFRKKLMKPVVRYRAKARSTAQRYFARKRK